MSMKKFCAFVSFVLVSGVCVFANAQAVPSLDSIKNQEELTKAITTLDKELFDAYNTCNIEKLGTLVVDDLEFYTTRRVWRWVSKRFWMRSRTTSAGR